LSFRAEAWFCVNSPRRLIRSNSLSGTLQTPQRSQPRFVTRLLRRALVREHRPRSTP